MSGFESPNYTQTPNDLFDTYLRDMGEAELKVVMCVCRHTFGYHRTKCEMSLRNMATFTGMAQNSVLAGALAAEKRGLIKRKKPDNENSRITTVWEAIVIAEPTETTASVGEADCLSSRGTTASFAEGQLGLNKKESIKESKRNARVGGSSPSKSKKESDVRKDHPAIRAMVSTVGRYPQKDYWDAIIEALGDSPDRPKLASCWEAWKKTAFNKTSVAWAIDWYRNGIPAGLNGNGNGYHPGTAPAPDKPAPSVTKEGALYV